MNTKTLHASTLNEAATPERGDAKAPVDRTLNADRIIGNGPKTASDDLPKRSQPGTKPAGKQPPAVAQNNGLPIIETNGEHLRHQSQAALAALIKANSPPRVFIRNGELTRIQVDEAGRATIKDMSVPMLRGELTRSANFVSTSKANEEKAVNPPKEVAEDVLVLPNWPGIPPLKGVVTAPVFSHKGQLETTPGYHAAARLWYHETCQASIPDTEPTEENISRARSLLLDDLLVDFPFVDEASRAHAVALILLPFVRPMITGPTPLHLIDAPDAGTGKGLLANVCTIPFMAGGTPVKSPPTEEAEWSKVLTSTFKDGDSHLLIDNVRSLNSPSLLGALTSTEYKDRLLGTNRTVSFENRLVWLATCNNIQANDELTRRSVWIRMDANMEQPETRSAFRHTDLADWAGKNRAALIGAALTLIHAWVWAGQPRYNGTPLGSFEAWGRVMGGILENAAIPGFLSNREEQRSHVDTGTATLRSFVEAWHERYQQSPVIIAELFPLATEWIPERLGDGSKQNADRSQQTKLGMLLKRNVDKVFAGQKIVSAGTATSGPNKNKPQYRLEPTSTAKPGDLGGLGRPSQVPHSEKSKSTEHIPVGVPLAEVSYVSQVSLASHASSFVAWLKAAGPTDGPTCRAKMRELGCDPRETEAVIDGLKTDQRIYYAATVNGYAAS